MERRHDGGSLRSSPNSAPAPEAEKSTRVLPVDVVEVIDGDTLLLEREGIREEVDLDGIDAPELDQPFGKLARSALRKHAMTRDDLVMANPVRAEDGRVRARILAGELDLSVTMADTGLAWALPWHEDIVRAEIDAWSDRRGLWTERRPVPPWRWRALQTPRDTVVDP